VCLIQHDDPKRYFGGIVLDRDELRDHQWARILPLVPGGSEGKRGPRTDNRRCINALLWRARSGARWKDLPADFGAFQTVKRRYYRWLERGLIDRLFEELGQDADLEWLMSRSAAASRRRSGMAGPTFGASLPQAGMLDSTIIRAHQHAAGAPKKKGARKPRVWAVQRAVSRQSFPPPQML
jgi:transposase